MYAKEFAVREKVKLVKIAKSYGDVQAIKNVSLTVAEGEFVSLLGASGCGKTTILRMIAGFEQPTGGLILVEGQDLTKVPAHKRGIGYVFQNFALWPHLTVYENVAFGLKLRNTTSPIIKEEFDRVADILRISSLAERFPRQLSGGQQQRVALARVLALRPSIVLFDEPLSSLDKNLRVKLRSELRGLQKKLGWTVLFVTHDQDEAFSMSDKVVVLHEGKVLQSGSPEEIYFQPTSEFVANFVGKSNIFQGVIVDVQVAHIAVELSPGRKLIVDTVAGAATHCVGDMIKCMLRPERVLIGQAATSTPNNQFEGVIETIQFNGAVVECGVRLDGCSGSNAMIAVETSSYNHPRLGDSVRAGLPSDEIRIIDKGVQ